MRVIVLLLVVLLPFACQYNERESKAVDEARIEREVARRVDLARKEMAGRDALLHTVGLIVIGVLTLGAVVGLLRSRQLRFASSVMPANRVVQANRIGGTIQQLRPLRNAYRTPRTGRVIDLRPVTSSKTGRQALQQEQPAWIRQRKRRRRNSDPDWQPDPPWRHRHRGNPPRS